MTPPDWLRMFSVTDGFRFYGLVRSSDEKNFDKLPVDINISEKPGNFVWNYLLTLQEIIPLVNIEKHAVPIRIEGYEMTYPVKVTKEGFKYGQ